MKVCSNCSTELTDEAVKCPKCQKTVCSNCGNALGTEVHECPKCGQKSALGTKVSNIQAVMLLIGIILTLVFTVPWLLRSCGS